MTVETQATKVQVLGNDVATVFSFDPLVIFKSSDLLVVKTDASGVETTLAEGEGSTNYEVTVAEFPGTGSITYPASGSGGDPLASGEKITIKRVLTFEQTTDLENQGGYFPDVQETALDKIVMMILQQDEELDRVLRIPISDPSVTLELPTVNARANKLLGFDEDGNAIPVSGVTDVLVTPFAETLLDDLSAADALTTLGVSAFAQSLLDDADAAAAQATLGLVIGTDVQADLDVVPQLEAEAGTATIERIWTAERVGQAIAALETSVDAASEAEMEAASIIDKMVTPGRAHFHPSAAKGWVIFNGTGTVAIQDSYNVLSVSDNGTGSYSVFWDTDFPSAEYPISINVQSPGASTPVRNAQVINGGQAAGNVQIETGATTDGTLQDMTRVYVSAFGDQ